MDNLSPPSQFKLQLAYWFVTHKVLLKKIGAGLAFAVALSFVGYGLFGLSLNFITAKRYTLLLNDITENRIDFQSYKIRLKPLPLAKGSVNVFKSGENQYDFLAQVKNPNDRWFIKKIIYQFVTENFSTPKAEDYLLPEQNKYLSLLAYKSNVPPRSPDVKIIETDYELVRTPLDVNLTDFIIKDIEYVPKGTSSPTLPRTKFKVTNNSLYDFWEIPFKVILESPSLPVAVNVTSLTQFKSGESKEVELVWFENLSYYAITKVTVIPDINFFDPAVYMPKETDLSADGL